MVIRLNFPTGTELGNRTIMIESRLLVDVFLKYYFPHDEANHLFSVSVREVFIVFCDCESQLARPVSKYAANKSPASQIKTFVAI